MRLTARALNLFVEQLLTRLKPGAALLRLAQAKVPIWRADRFADAHPEPAFAGTNAHSPFLAEIAASEPRPAATGPLAGEAVVIKDAINVRGMPTTLGLMSTVLARPEEDAEIVRRIRAAGGWVRAKTKMTELGIDGLGAGALTGMPHNPVAPGYFPGGSSTGSAVAVAAGLARYAIGTDGLGSVRIPAALCGLVGLKSGRDRLPREGTFSPTPTMDVMGPIARSVEDTARLWQVIVGEPVRPIAPLAPCEVGVIRSHGPERAARAQRDAFARALDRAGLRAVPVDVPGAESCTFLGGVFSAGELVSGPHCDEEMTMTGRVSVAMGRALGPAELARLAELRAALTDATEAALRSVPVLAMPTTAIPPPAVTRRLLDGEQDVVLLRALGAYTPLANLTGMPAIAVPAGVDERGRPLSIMFQGPKGSEAMLLQLALTVERTGVGTEPI